MNLYTDLNQQKKINKEQVAKVSVLFFKPRIYRLWFLTEEWLSLKLFGCEKQK